MTATMRVTSKDLGFMVALQTRYEVSFKRVPKQHWWWIRKRFRIDIPLDGNLGSPDDFWTRASVIEIANNRGSYFFTLEVIDGQEYEKVF